jgi:hypothetical protein
MCSWKATSGPIGQDTAAMLPQSCWSLLISCASLLLHYCCCCGDEMAVTFLLQQELLTKAGTSVLLYLV